jgi:GPH family glycoside/pentoside/hexuronide:cation symporter
LAPARRARGWPLAVGFLHNEEGLSMDRAERLPVRVKLGFGVGDLGGNLYFTVIAFWLLIYLTDTVGIAAGLAGIVIMVSKIWDAVVDPFIGYISDRTRTRWGRRRPYILFASVPSFIMMLVLFTNPRLGSQAALAVWGVLAGCGLATAYSLVNIPYSSLTPELTKDYNERTGLNGYRAIFMVVGTLFGAGAALPIVNALPNRNLGFSVMGGFFGALMMGSALVTFFSVREPPAQPASKPMMGFLKSYFHVFRNRPYVIILCTYLLNLMAVTVVSGIMVYYFKYLFNAEAMTTVGLMILLVTAMLFIPVAVAVAKKIGKKNTYALGMLVIALTCVVIFFLGHVLGMGFVLVMMFVAGVGLSTTYPIPWAMIPDTVEYGYLQTGERREGGYYGVWTFVAQTGQALATALSGLILQVTGYVPEVAQTPLANLGIRLLLGPITGVIFIGAALLVAFYPLNEKRYNEVLARIADMEAGRAAPGVGSLGR